VLPRLRAPSDESIAALLARNADAPFSYAEVGATKGALPTGYDHAQVRFALGTGDAVFAAACDAIRSWRMFALGWVQLHGADQVPAPGVTVAPVAHVLGLWSANVARVVYVVDEPSQFGFAYGTLTAHAESGEELFLVGREPDGAVWYEIKVFSRPQLWWSKLGKPVVAARQRRFRKDSGAAMIAACRRGVSP
jgi:uncharacterized protein (UPF0548 family)